MPGKLKVGDSVLWRGGWGRDLPREANITSIEIVEANEKEGTPVESAPWDIVEHHVVVNLNNNHWAYGYQIKPLPADWPVDSTEEPCEAESSNG